MEKLFMSAGIITVIVLCFVGIIKLPFNSFKSKYPNLYKAIFTILSFILAIVLSVLDELYILCGEIISIDFLILLCAVFAGIFGGYGGIYEGLGVKKLVKKIIENAKKAIAISNNEKVVKYLNKIEDVENAIAILEERKNNQVNEV